MPKVFNSPPLPFVGQKRNWVKTFRNLLTENIPDAGDGWTVVDVFGGSGILSDVAKRTLPKARVIYNDFDNYHERLEHIPETNALREKLLAIVDGCEFRRKLPPEIRARVIEAIDSFEGYKDFSTIATWFVFTGNTCREWEKVRRLSGLYDRVPSTPYPSAEGYLDGVETVTKDFEELMAEHAGNHRALFVLDPPYLCTAQDAYKKAEYFDLICFLRLTQAIRPPFLVFSSDKSEFPRYVDYSLRTKTLNCAAFTGASLLYRRNSMGGGRPQVHRLPFLSIRLIMPMLHVCAYPGCHTPVPLGVRYCRRHEEKGEKRDARLKAARDKRRTERAGSSTERGYGYSWQKRRTAFLRGHPLCEECRKRGRITPATDVDHIRPHKGDPELFWDWDNLQALCHECHSKKTAREDGGFGNGIRRGSGRP